MGGGRRGIFHLRMKAAARGLRALRASERAASAVEFALVVPMLVTFLFGIFEFGRAIWTQSLLDYAVEEASRCATVNATSCGTAALTTTYAANDTAPLNIPASAFSLTVASCGNLVQASYAFTFIASGLFPYHITLTSQSCFPI
jgi:Flp pilus assembly protein TadG